MQNKAAGQKIIIVGGVAGGASAAARLRRLDETVRIILLERGEYISFANCGLPYYIGGDISARERLILQTPQSFAERFNIEVRTGEEAISLDCLAKTLKIKKNGAEYTENYDRLILSPGAAPIIPPIAGLDSARVFTLRTVPDADRLKTYITERSPRSAVIIGGGYIGIELADNLRRSGLEVSIVEMSEQIVAPFDYEIACVLHQHLRRNGVKLLLKNSVTAVQENASGLTFNLSSGELSADLLILAIGVRPESTLAKTAGLALNERGCIIVDENMRTSDPNIYAVGDAVEIVNFVSGQKGFVPLAGPANKQGRIAADNICGLASRYRGTQGSSILSVMGLTAGATGLNEKTARQLQLNYEKIFIYPADHAAYYPGAETMLLKILFAGNSGKILGAQIVGKSGVDKRLDVLATAIRAGMTAFELASLELCYAPPYSSAKDPVNIAGFVAENILTGKVQQFHWHEVDSLPRDGSVTLLDVRDTRECTAGSLTGFVNIPLNDLRRQLPELDKRKPVYIICAVGLRGYLAARILSQNGFEAFNLSGGYNLYQTVLGG
ncbi:MAG: FAD-dependent oxidoreductase [Candidatus Margulisbacteria bacterium]|jgi:NADPH-dependent 2,4-dienoyl-CoA reductase/sulfur reductase-like enzyme/rhodanese-related sulfurtransferase|nr:FAD-dependent oxidoreductase [Candidatus Margulisiibacteriota bacterium]